MNLFLPDPTIEPDELDVVVLHRTPRGWEPLRERERLGLTQQDVDEERMLMADDAAFERRMDR